MDLNRNRGNNNLNYKDGFLLERINFQLLKSIIMRVLGATAIEETTRSIIDLATGVDAYATIRGNIYGISLRVREKDYDSFTLNRHITDVNSEVNKWLKNRSNKIKPAYHVQCAKGNNGIVTVTRINIDAFAIHLATLIENKELEQYFNDNLLAYEFKHSDIENLRCVSTFIYYV